MKLPENGPLEGVRVIDLTRMLPGPFCTMLLADMGADVTIIEQASGPNLGPRRKDFHVDRNKKSLILNLKDPRGKDIFFRLAKEADVVVEGFRPGVTQRLGIDYENIKELNQGIVYCSISGYGQDGPYRDRVGHDINYISIAGLLSLNGEKGGPPVPPGTQVADIAGGGLMAANSILAALFLKQKTGRGQYIDISMMDGSLSFNAVTFHEYFSTGKAPQRGAHRLLGGIPCYNVYETGDNMHISIGALEPKFWATLCRVLERDDLLSKQHDDSPETMDEMKAIFASRTRAEWEELLGDEDICFAPVLDLEETYINDHVRHRNMIVEQEGPGNNIVKHIGIAPKLSLTPGTIRIPPPSPGQDTRGILTGLGLDPHEISLLEKDGVIKGEGS